MTSHVITGAVNLDSIVKLGSVAGIAWTRVTTTATITQNSHGMVTNDLFNVTVSSSAAAITVGVKTVTVTGTNTFTFTCLNAGAASGTVTADHIDNYLVNGGYLTVDQHTRYGVNQGTSAPFGDITLSATLGGTIEFNSTLVRAIAYDTGSGTVPALGTTISQGSASGILLSVQSSLTDATTAAGDAMPASGYIQVRQWNGTAYAAGALTGIGANATAADRAGWLHIVGRQSGTIRVNRLNLFKVRGAYYDFQGGTTDGTRATTYQLPLAGGGTVYLNGVEVQSAAATVTAASWADDVVTYTAAGHGFLPGQLLTVESSSPADYDVVDAVILNVTNDTFSVAMVGDPGTWVSGSSATVYEVYPCAGSRTALLANVATDVVRGRWCWISTAGLVRFGHDGTNSTGGYCPPSGRKIRVPNIFFSQCPQANPVSDTSPHAALASRPDFATTGGGVIDIDKACLNWYLIFSQPFSVSLTNVRTFESIFLGECASELAWRNVCVEQQAANTQIALTLSLCFGALDACVWTRAAQATAVYVVTMTDCVRLSVRGGRYHSLTKAANLTAGSTALTRVSDSTFDRCVWGGGRVAIVACTTVTFTDAIYYDVPSLTTSSTIAMYAYDLNTAASVDITIDGLSWGGLDLCQPYSGVLSVGVAGCADITLRNLGTAAAPLGGGGAYVDATWTRVTTTMTVTKVAHGLKANDLIAVNVCSDVAPRALTTTSGTLWTVATAPTADTFTVVVTNAGQTAGQYLSYYPCVMGALVHFVTGSAVRRLRVQRCYVPHVRLGLLATNADNSANDVLLENAWATEWSTQIMAALNAFSTGLALTPSLTAQTAVYGTHFTDAYTTAEPANLAGVTWDRTTTVARVTSTAHGLRPGDRILVTVTSDAAAIVLGIKTVLQNTAGASPPVPADVFSFTCLNAGAASGTLTFVVLNGRMAVLMNEATAETDGTYTFDAGAPAFTSAGSLYMPAVNDQVTFTWPRFVVGHKYWPVDEVTLGGTIANYNLFYAIDTGAGFGAFHNLRYQRAGGGGSGASTTVTMTDTTGVEAGDYVWGTNIAPLARVVTVDSSTNITVNIANLGTVSGTLRFNHLPFESNIPATGVRMKVRIVTITANVVTITSVMFYTNTTATERAYTYDLDPVALSVTALSAADLSEIQNARVYLEAAAGGDLNPGDVILNALTDADGNLTDTFAYTNPQPVVGRVRKGTSAPYFKTGLIAGTITDEGLTTTVFLVPDE